MRENAQAAKRWEALWVALFFLGVLVVGFVTASDYGCPWDENDETDILRMNLWEYSRALGLDESVFEAWAARERETISALTPIGESIEQDHGVAAFYPLAGVMLDLHITEHSRMVIWHLYCWALFTLGLAALYFCCRELGLPKWAGLLAALFVLLTPRFFAQGHYNNKDMVLFSFALCVLWQGLRLMKKPSFPRALLFALAGAFAANTKVAGAALWLLAALFVLARQIAQKKWSLPTACVGCVTLLTFGGFYALLTPALWRDPAAFFGYLTQNAMAFGRWQNYLRFRGVTFDTAKGPLPWYYLPYMIFATTPLWALFLMAAGLFFAARALWKNRRGLAQSDESLGLLLTILLWLCPLGFAVVTRTTVYNGWRHFYFLYGFLILLAVCGLAGLCRLARGRARGALCVLLALCLLFTGVGIVTQHPYQYAYYQPLIRLFTQSGDLELDYWNVSVYNALCALAEGTEGELRVSPADEWARAGLARTLPALPLEIGKRFTVAKPGEGDYVLVNPTYALFSGFEAAGRERVSIVSYGQPIMQIFTEGKP